MKKYTFIFLLLTFLTQLVSAQIVFDKSTYNFGDLEPGEKTYVDFKLTNAGKTTAEIKEVETPYGIAYLYSKKRLAPDSTALLRLYYIPKIKGKFKKEIKVFVTTMAQPLLLTIKGNLKYADVHASLEVPPFPEAARQKEKPMETAQFNIVDSATKMAINNANVKIIWNGLDYKNIHSYADGSAKQKLYLDNYYVVVNAKGYKTYETAITLSDSGKSFQIAMIKGKSQTPVVAEVQNEINKGVVVPKDTTQKIIKTKPKVYTQEIVKEQPVPRPKPEPELSAKLYKPNNIVFLIDKSTSMGKNGRMDLLKASMFKLLSVLRPIDKIAVVAFSDESQTIVQSQFCKDKESIKNAIKNIKPEGFNNLGHGINVAYNVARFGFIKGGNNMIIVATDGVISAHLNENEIIKRAQNGMKLSIIGIKVQPSDVQQLKDLTQKGQGAFINVQNYEAAENNLVNEIKSASLIGH